MLPSEQPKFTGYPPPTSSTTYTPNQFFDVVLPNGSRGVVRIVGYMLRRILGWSDADGNPREPQVSFTYSELVERANVSRTMIRQAIAEAISMNFIRCIREAKPNLPGQSAVSGLYELAWDDQDEYVREIENFRGFYSKNGNLTNIPNKFFDYTLREESLSVVKVVGAIIRHTIGFQSKFGMRRQQVEVSFSSLERITGIRSHRLLGEAIAEALARNHVIRIVNGEFRAGVGSEASVYAVRWSDQPVAAEPSGPKKGGPDPGSNFFAQKRTGRKSPAAGHQTQDVDRTRTTGRKGGRSFQENFAAERLSDGQKRGAGERSEKGGGDGQKKGARTVRNGGPERSEKGGRIEITDQITINDSNKYAAADSEGLELLLKAGFDEKAAAELCARAPAEVIRRQVELLPGRGAKRNPLGLLRKAIEENWAPPPQQLATPNRLERQNARAAAERELDSEYQRFTLEEAKRWREAEPELWETFLAEDEVQRGKLRASAQVTGVSAKRVLDSFDSPAGKDRRFADYLLRLERVPTPRAFAAGKRKLGNE